MECLHVLPGVAARTGVHQDRVHLAGEHWERLAVVVHGRHVRDRVASRRLSLGRDHGRVGHRGLLRHRLQGSGVALGGGEAGAHPDGGPGLGERLVRQPVGGAPAGQAQALVGVAAVGAVGDHGERLFPVGDDGHDAVGRQRHVADGPADLIPPGDLRHLALDEVLVVQDDDPALRGRFGNGYAGPDQEPGKRAE
jgi:hypothetical protein